MTTREEEEEEERMCYGLSGTVNLMLEIGMRYHHTVGQPLNVQSLKMVLKIELYEFFQAGRRHGTMGRLRLV